MLLFVEEKDGVDFDVSWMVMAEVSLQIKRK